MDSNGKVMEFHMKATVGAVFMFDMSLFLSFLRQSAMWAPYPALRPSPRPSAPFLMSSHCFWCIILLNLL